MKRTLTHLKLPLIILLTLILVILVALFVAGAVAYEQNFGVRYETVALSQYSLDKYDGLQVERSDFTADGVALAGYQYFKTGREVKGVIVLAHGLGGGGHIGYLPFIDRFTADGYLVFAYDARGNDNSGGESVGGLPQGVICLDAAISHVEQLAQYQGLPVVLFGHSWGGYSVGNVLKFHPEVKAAVMLAGFNDTVGMLEYYGEQKVGKLAHVLVPFMSLYERIKFGKYAATSAVKSIADTDANIMVIHSDDDTTVPVRYGYDKIYEKYADCDRFTFVPCKYKGHDIRSYCYDSKIMQQMMEFFDDACIRTE